MGDFFEFLGQSGVLWIGILKGQGMVGFEFSRILEETDREDVAFKNLNAYKLCSCFTIIVHLSNYCPQLGFALQPKW